MAVRSNIVAARNKRAEFGFAGGETPKEISGRLATAWRR